MQKIKTRIIPDSVFILMLMFLFFININSYLLYITLLTTISMYCIMLCVNLWNKIIEDDKRFFCIIRSIIKPKEYKKEMDSFLKGMEHYRQKHKHSEVDSILNAYKHFKDAKTFVEINKRTGFKTCLINVSQQKYNIHYEINSDKKVIISNSYDFQRMCLIICQYYKYDTIWTNSYYIRD